MPLQSSRLGLARKEGTLTRNSEMFKLSLEKTGGSDPASFLEYSYKKISTCG